MKEKKESLALVYSELGDVRSALEILSNHSGLDEISGKIVKSLVRNISGSMNDLDVVICSII